MKLIVGLGNPGEKYAHTRHNTGFMIIDAMAQEQGTDFQFNKKFDAQIGESSEVKFVKPQTFMNESGKAVQRAADFYKIDNENIIVVHDDVDLDLGKVRVVLGGSSGGHKGVQSVIDHLGADNFWRVRVGVGRSDVIATEDWVLKNFEDLNELNNMVDKIADFVIQSDFIMQSETFEIN